MTPTPFIAQAAAQQMSPMDGLLQTAPMILFFIAIFYFIVIRPQQKEQQEGQTGGSETSRESTNPTLARRPRNDAADFRPRPRRHRGK